MADYIFINDDYATAGPFYYGYETTKCLECGKISQGSPECHEDADTEWCFVYGKTIIPYSDLVKGHRFQKWDVADCLLAGILIVRERALNNSKGEGDE